MACELEKLFTLAICHYPKCSSSSRSFVKRSLAGDKQMRLNWNMTNLGKWHELSAILSQISAAIVQTYSSHKHRRTNAHTHTTWNNAIAITNFHGEVRCADCDHLYTANSITNRTLQRSNSFIVANPIRKQPLAARWKFHICIKFCSQLKLYCCVVVRSFKQIWWYFIDMQSRCQLEVII